MAEVSTPKLVIAAGISGLIAAGAVMMYLTSVESKYKKANEPVQEVTVSVVVPRENIAKGDRLTIDKLASRRVPEQFVPSDAILASDIDSIIDRTLLTGVLYGRPMVWHAVTSTKSRTFSDVVELGRRAMTIKINDVDAIDGLLRPGDKIDVMGTFQLKSLGIAGSAGDVDDDAVMPVLQDVEVIEAARVDKNGRRYETRTDTSSKDGIDLDFTLITMNLNSKQIARVELAQATGGIFAVLRNRADTSYAGYEYLGVDFLLTEDKPDPIDVVMGDDGKPVGRIIGDKVVDKDGNVIGKVVNGKAVGLDGKELGSITTGIDEDDPMLRVASVADVVRDADGNIVGRIVDGKVVDRAGNVIGRVVNGKAVSNSGEALGVVAKGVALDADGNEVDLSGTKVKQAMVFDASGKPIGKVVGDNIVDSNGRVVGKVVNGKAVSLDGKPLGKIVKNISAGDPITRVAEVADVVRDKDGKIIGKISDVVRDENGNVIGRIVDGKVVDNSGNVIGEVVDGKPVSLSGESLGTIDKGVALDQDGNVVGRVVDGKVVDSSGNEVGTVQKGVALDANGQEVDLSSSAASSAPTRIDKVVRDSSGNIIGRVVDGKVVDSSGKVIGSVDKNGNAVSLSGESLGKVDEVLVNEAGMVVGKPAEVVRNAKGEIVGRIENGKVVDENGNVIGRVDKDGKPVGLDGRSLGSVEKVMLDNDGKLISGDLVEDSVSVVRDENGEIIGRLVDGKVVNADGEVVGTVVDGQVISNTGEVLASGVSIDTASKSEVEAAAAQADSASSSRRAGVIDFIPGGTAADGITPVVKVRLQ